ncbi:MAG: hypothetical protein LBK65_10015 [Tannerellaceae bacterium]|jgi:hypothetical protein|nr:hypothetical protein [Tannerellaceae bacterium]
MNIIKLRGEDQQLYYLVAHLIMNEDVLGYNLNYPYRTSPDYLWFVAMEEDHTLGFIPVKLKYGNAKINNYYVADDDSAVFSALLQEITTTLISEYELEAVTHMRHIPDFEKNGFSVTHYWKRYVKMRAFKDEKKCL